MHSINKLKDALLSLTVDWLQHNLRNVSLSGLTTKWNVLLFNFIINKKNVKTKTITYKYV